MHGKVLKTVTHEAPRIALKMRSICLVYEQNCGGLLLPACVNLNSPIA